MATKKSTSKTVKKTTAKKPAAKKEVVKKTVKPVETNIYTANISILLGMAVEAIILLLAYLIIMSHIN